MNEGKKDRRDPIRTVKPRNFVAKNAGTTTSGAGAHKDKKKAMKQGEVKHKGKEYAEGLESKLKEAFEKDICPVCGCTPCNCTHIVAEGWGAERQARELEASNAAWRDMLAQYANDPEMTEYLTMFRISNWSPKKAEAESKRWIEDSKPLPSWYLDIKSGKRTSGYKIGEDQGIDDIIAWKQAVKKAYPQYADKMRFKGVGSQISAELPGLDRSFGVFDLETGTGQVLDEGKIYLEKLAVALDEAVKKI